MSVDCGVVGVILCCGVLAPEFEAEWFQFGLQNAPRSCHDHATIAPRSGHDQGPGHTSHTVRSRGSDSIMKEQRSRLDRAAIAVRSGRDRGVLPHVFSAVRFESDAPDLLQKEKKIGRCVAVRPRSCSLNFDADGLSSGCHVARGKSSDPRHLSSILRTWWKKSTRSPPLIPHLTLAKPPRHLQ